MPDNNQQIDIIMFAMSHYTDWQKGRVNRNYHIVEQLQLDNRVRKIVMVDFLPFSWRKAAKIYKENIITGMKDADIIYGDLTSSCHQINNKLYVYSTIDSIYSQKTVVKELYKIVKSLQLKNIVFWSYNPLMTVSLEDLGRQTFGHKVFVFDAVDNWLEHPAFAKQKNKLRIGYELVRRDADIIFTVSERLQNTLFAGLDKVYWVPNGIDIRHFAPAASWSMPTELKNLPRPIIGYHGVIEQRVDLDLVAKIAQQRPDWSIVLIGAGIWHRHRAAVIKKLASFKNVKIIDFISYQKLPPYVWSFDVAFVPHQVNDFTQSMNPMKLYEYMAAGKPIVTTPISGSETFGDLLVTATKPEQFIQAIDSQLKNDTPQKQQLRLEAIADDAWHSRVEMMMRFVSKKL